MIENDMPNMNDFEGTDSDGNAKVLGDLLKQLFEDREDRDDPERQEREERMRSEERAEARATDLVDVKTEAFVRVKRALEACATNHALIRKAGIVGNVAAVNDGEAGVKREDMIASAHTAIGTLAEIGIKMDRRLREIDASLDRIAVALETANNMKD